MVQSLSFLLSVTLVYWLVAVIIPSNANVVCRDPDLGGQVHSKDRKFVLIGGAGAGIGNFLIFFPAAYYFAALTGRDLIVTDDSAFGELCEVLICGFPKLSEVRAAFPKILNDQAIGNLKGAKVWDMARHLSGEAPLNEIVVRADGYKYMSGWYDGNAQADECITRLTGCVPGDISCHDRHALQRLVRGPFKLQYALTEESRIIGVPQNLKHAIFSLPHSYSPRLDAAVHMRCQFMHFERLVGPEDGAAWLDAIKERDDFVTAHGPHLFQTLETKIVEMIPFIKQTAAEASRRRKLYLDIYQESYRKLTGESGNAEVAEIAAEYSGRDDDGKVYIYLASDNEIVKEAFAHYLTDHRNISVMRMMNRGNIVHAKNLNYLRQANNNTGVIDLMVDWYALTLSNVLLAWRRDTGLLSTFAQVSCRCICILAVRSFVSSLLAYFIFVFIRIFACI